MIEGAPIDTSFGDELYGRLFSDRAVGRTTRPVAETA
jgi:hypothetical protein